jgi:cell shape-determining protein MreC
MRLVRELAVGDEVISADVNGVKGPQLYFGRVTRAEFLAGGQWDVRVQPAASLNDLDSVGILRLGLQRAIAEKDQKPVSERRRTP